MNHHHVRCCTFFFLIECQMLHLHQSEREENVGHEFDHVQAKSMITLARYKS